MSVDLVCRACHAQFTVPYKHRGRVYCSRACANGPAGTAFAERRRASHEQRRAEMQASGVKRCTLCNKERPLDQYRVNRNGWPHSWCNACRLEYCREDHKWRSRVSA
jgi:hypothetical protein